MTPPDPGRPAGGRKRYVLAVAVAVVLLGVALVVWRVIPRDQASHITSSEALRLFDHHMRQGSPAKTNGGNWPEPGVYRYETTGGEAIDTDLFDASHDYGGLSTVTLWPGGCGLVERWQVLATRWRESEMCGDGNSRARTHFLREFREFFGQSQEDAFECGGWPAPQVAEKEPRFPVTSICRSPATTVSSRVRVLGIRRMRVGGEPVVAVHLKGTSSAEGESSGAAVFNEWRRRGDGLLLRRTVDGAVDSEANGGFRYRESYSIELLSLTPER